MSRIKNPILKGFHADPCLCRRGDDYYIAVSSFEWFPGIPVYHSKDMKNWRLLTHVLNDEAAVDLKRLPSAKGIWAPCLTWCEEDGLFYVVYGVMNSMEARYFDVDNYMISAENITGPWSEPVYIHSSGFDASLFHDDDGRKWIVSLEWETRQEYEKPGMICLVEYDAVKKEIIGYPKRMWGGGTDRGCMEAPHMYKRNGYYYIMCAEGGTGYGHSVTVGRSRDIWGPYEPDPQNPILTSVPGQFYERHDPDHLKPKYFNPEAVLQKAGHGSIMETSAGEVYMAHLCSRPFVPELRCTLGRETALQKMYWTEDDWLRLDGGGNLVKEYFTESVLPEHPWEQEADRDDFNASRLQNCYYAPRIAPGSFTSLNERNGWLRVRGQESLCSLNRASILARKLTSVRAGLTVRMDFMPEVYQHSAGLVLYYDNMNYLFLRKYYSQTLKGNALIITQLDNGEKTEHLQMRTALSDQDLCLRLCIEGRRTWFEWCYEGEQAFRRTGPVFDTTKYSDEYCQYGEFTGAFVGIGVVDAVLHRHHADFAYFEYIADEEGAVQ